MTESFDGSRSYHTSEKHQDKKKLLQLLWLRKDKQYRSGMIQCACSFDIINNEEAKLLRSQIKAGEACCLILEI